MRCVVSLPRYPVTPCSSSVLRCKLLKKLRGVTGPLGTTAQASKGSHFKLDSLALVIRLFTETVELPLLHAFLGAVALCACPVFHGSPLGSHANAVAVEPASAQVTAHVKPDHRIIKKVKLFWVDRRIYSQTVQLHLGITFNKSCTVCRCLALLLLRKWRHKLFTTARERVNERVASPH